MSTSGIHNRNRPAGLTFGAGDVLRHPGLSLPTPPGSRIGPLHIEVQHPSGMDRRVAMAAAQTAFRQLARSTEQLRAAAVRNNETLEPGARDAAITRNHCLQQVQALLGGMSALMDESAEAERLNGFIAQLPAPENLTLETLRVQIPRLWSEVQSYLAEEVRDAVPFRLSERQREELLSTWRPIVRTLDALPPELRKEPPARSTMLRLYEKIMQARDARQPVLRALVLQEYVALNQIRPVDAMYSGFLSLERLQILARSVLTATQLYSRPVPRRQSP